MARTITVPDDIADALQATGFTIPQGDEIQAVSIDAQALGTSAATLAGLIKALPSLIAILGSDKAKKLLAALPQIAAAFVAKDWATLLRIVAELFTPATA